MSSQCRRSSTPAETATACRTSCSRRWLVAVRWSAPMSAPSRPPCATARPDSWSHQAPWVNLADALRVLAARHGQKQDGIARPPSRRARLRPARVLVVFRRAPGGRVCVTHRVVGRRKQPSPTSSNRSHGCPRRSSPARSTASSASASILRLFVIKRPERVDCAPDRRRYRLAPHLLARSGADLRRIHAPLASHTCAAFRSGAATPVGPQSAADAARGRRSVRPRGQGQERPLGVATPFDAQGVSPGGGPG